MNDDFQLETERTILRSFRCDDLDEHVAILSDWNVTKWLSNNIPSPYSRKAGEKFIEEAQANFTSSDNIYFSLIEKKTRRHMGAVRIFSYRQEECEVGYWLGADFWRQGFADEFINAIITMIFDFGFTKTIVALTSKNNLGSRRLLEKNGFIHKGAPPPKYAKCGHGDGCSEYYRLERNNGARK